LRYLAVFLAVMAVGIFSAIPSGQSGIDRIRETDRLICPKYRRLWAFSSTILENGSCWHSRSRR